MSKRLWCSLILLLCLIGVSMGEKVPENKGKKKPENKAEWFDGSQVDEAIEKANKEGRPIVFIWRHRVSDCPLHNGKCAQWENAKDLKDFIGVIIYGAEEPEKRFRDEIHSQVPVVTENKENPQEKNPETKESSKSPSTKTPSEKKLVLIPPIKGNITVPRLYLTDGDLKLITCIPYASADKDFSDLIKETLKEFGPIYDAKTIESFNKMIKKAEDNIAGEKYQPAITDLLELKKKRNRSVTFKRVDELLISISTVADERLVKIKTLIDDDKNDEAKQELETVKKEFKGLPEIVEQIKDLNDLLNKTDAKTK